MTDRRTDGRTDGRTEAIAISPTLFFKKRGDNNLCRERHLEALYSTCGTCFEIISVADEGYQLFRQISKHVYQDTLISMIF